MITKEHSIERELNNSDSSDEILVVIPARGGSKRLPDKNVRLLAGKPLIFWTIETAIKAYLGARIVVTSDDSEILKLTQHYASDGIIAHKRPQELATDTASTVDTLIDVIETEKKLGFRPKTVILLQPTSPLREVEDVLSAVKIFKKTNRLETVVSVCEVDHPTAWTGVVGSDLSYTGIDFSAKRSQDYPAEYRLNGAIYVVPVEHLMGEKNLFTKNLRALVMPRIRSIDIDEEIDFRMCEALLNG
ncbi:acylneuraminate cytidylyltransferase family protein [Idiomarina loihiensis]|uniref:acylneuraminate cytidylyltransferase family protein n=1 Tax=Idiomarina loihiensis TaxID=135577 RepID=UPI00315978F5